MEKFNLVQRGQNIVTTVNGVVKTKVIADKVERDTFKADIQKIIDSKKADSTKEKELLAMFVSKETKREEVKKAIVQVVEKVKEVKKKEKEIKKEPVKEEKSKKEVVKKYKSNTTGKIEKVPETSSDMITISLTDLKALIQDEIAKVTKSDYVKEEKPVQPKTNNRGEY